MFLLDHGEGCVRNRDLYGIYLDRMVFTTFAIGFLTVPIGFLTVHLPHQIKLEEAGRLYFHPTLRFHVAHIYHTLTTLRVPAASSGRKA